MFSVLRRFNITRNGRLVSRRFVSSVETKILVQNSKNKVDMCLEEERIFKPLNVEMFKNVYKTNIDMKSKVKHILGVYEHGKYTTMEMPTDISDKDMAYLLELCDEEKELDRALKFFYKRECTRYHDRKKKQRQQITRTQKKEELGLFDEWSYGIWDTNNELTYGLWKNSLISRITKQTVRDYRQNHLLKQSAQFGQKLLIDLDYDQYMKLYECRLLAVQLGLLFYENRLNRDFQQALPFDIHFVNCQKSKTTLEAVEKQIKKMDQCAPYFHQQSYLEMPDLFPKERLIYLSPHSREPLRNYDHDAIYILGAYNDRSSHVQISHVKAASEGIRCYRLPLDENVLWKQGNKNLCLNQVAAILHAVKATQDWKLAIQRFAPQRKIKSTEEVALEDEIRIKRVARRLTNIAKSRD